MRYIIFISFATMLAGCGVARMNQAANDYQASVAAYKQCVTTLPPAQCEGKRLAMEADERQYANRASAISGNQGAVSVNTQNR